MRFVFSLAVVLSAALLIAVTAPKAKKVPAPLLRRRSTMVIPISSANTQLSLSSLPRS